MPEAGRIGDVAQGEQAGGASMIGEAAQGSPDVIINHRAALRLDDAGQHLGPSGAGVWQAVQGSSGVFINGRPAVRRGDATRHGSEAGELVSGSPDVLLGEARGGAPRERPHDQSLTLDITDGLGRPIHDLRIVVSCPHHAHEERVIHGATIVGGLCNGATVTVQSALQTGEWDANASAGHAQAHHAHHHLGAKQAPGPDGESSGGASVKALVQAPIPPGTPADQQTLHLVRAKGEASVQLVTVHNWIELVYRAFGHGLPHGKKELALLGMREASLACAIAGEHPGVDDLEKAADAGDLEEVRFTREHKAPSYNDLLFCAWTDKAAHAHQHVEVFECTVDAGPGQGLLRLPFLTEGKVLHARPGAFDKAHPGSNVALHVFHGAHEKKEPQGTTAERVIAVAMKERGTVERYENLQKYGAWYGANGVYWCAQFVSWVFAHAGMPQIHYQGCSLGAGNFQNGAWGSWHGGKSHAEPGDIVFFNFPGEDVYDHTGIVVKDHGSYLSTVEGNTSPPGGSGSQSNGGGVYLKTRPKDGTIIGFGRPRFHKPAPVERSFIRWGGEGGRLHGKSMRGSTLLHHHYFVLDHHGYAHPDPKAERYRRFMNIYNHAANREKIPYLIVSSRYVKTYEEWVKWVEAHPGEVAGPRSVLLESGLRSPSGHAHHYLPSFLEKAYADRVLAHARRMHDQHKAAALRAELMGCLMSVTAS
jgi:uncharacterized Zn-binding protein involved in type VI secretion